MKFSREGNPCSTTVPKPDMQRKGPPGPVLRAICSACTQRPECFADELSDVIAMGRMPSKYDIGGFRAGMTGPERLVLTRELILSGQSLTPDVIAAFAIQVTP